MNANASFTCDIAVIGAGLAGLVAGVRAADSGRKVVLFEKLPDSVHLNNSRMTSGVFHLALADILGDENQLERRIIDVTGGAAHHLRIRQCGNIIIHAPRFPPANKVLISVFGPAATIFDYMRNSL